MKQLTPILTPLYYTSCIQTVNFHFTPPSHKRTNENVATPPTREPMNMLLPPHPLQIKKKQFNLILNNLYKFVILERLKHYIIRHLRHSTFTS